MARYTAKSLGLNHPNSLATAPNGDLYVTDFSQRVTVISPEGRVLRRWGGPGQGPGQFRFVAPDSTDPTSVSGKVAVGADSKVYVSDSGNGRVQVFTPQGSFIRQFGSFGIGKGQFLAPFDLVADNKGYVYVTDDQRQTLSKFSPAGQLIWQVGGDTSDPDLVGHFHLSMMDTHRRLVLTNDGNGRILYLDEGGHKVDVFGGSGALVKDGPCDVTADDAGYTYVTRCGSGPTLVFDRGHHLVAQWPMSDGVLATAPRFGQSREAFALSRDDSLVKLRATLERE